MCFSYICRLFFPYSQQTHQFMFKFIKIIYYFNNILQICLMNYICSIFFINIYISQLHFGCSLVHVHISGRRMADIYGGCAGDDSANDGPSARLSITSRRCSGNQVLGSPFSRYFVGDRRKQNVELKLYSSNVMGPMAIEQKWYLFACYVYSIKNTIN